MAAAVLLACVVAVSVALSAGHMQNQHAERGQYAMALAESVMELILSYPYDDPQGSSQLGPEAGEVGLVGFDNADDFHGYADSGGSRKDPAGQAYPDGYGVLTCTVKAAYISEALGGLSKEVSGLTVAVVVQDARGGVWTLTRFIPKPAD